MKLKIAAILVLSLAGCSEAIPGHFQTSVNTPENSGGNTSPSLAKRAYAKDMFPSAEAIAFQNADRQRRYLDARIEWDESRCALYEGMAQNGEHLRHYLLDDQGRKICVH